MNINQLATNIRLEESGVWKTLTTESISYTKDGHTLIKENEQNSFWFEHRLSCILNIFSKYPSKMALDIGGGNGLFSKQLQSINVDTVLLEPGLEGANNALHNGVKNIINGSLIDAGFVDSCFSSVFALDVLEHIEDDESFLLEINRILKPNGKLFLTVPAYQFLFSSFDKEVGHFRRYKLSDLKKKFVKNGFQINYQTYFFSLLMIPLFIGRFIINKLKRKENRISTGHINKSSIIGFILKCLLWPEQFLIKNKITIPFGSSCLIVAHKN